jgi:hypothetical protein
MAADRHLRAGDIPRLNVPPRRRSRSAAEVDLVSSVPDDLFQAHEAYGHQDEATQRARLLVASDPNDMDTRWTSSIARLAVATPKGSWNALTPKGEPVPLRNRDDARSLDRTNRQVRHKRTFR